MQGMSGNFKDNTQNISVVKSALVESQTRTDNGRVRSGRTAWWRGGVEQEWTLTDLFA